MISSSDKELEENCDFSSKNNVWTRFYEFLSRPFWILLAYFHYDRLFGILFLGFFSSHSDLDFRLQNSDFKLHQSDVPTELLYFYIDIYLFVKLKHIQRASTHIDLSLCWLNVVSLSAMPAQH